MTATADALGEIRIISASAGSGKTYRLAEELTEAIADDRVRPEAVVAVTFTNKAAGELYHRVRSHLLKEGDVSIGNRRVVKDVCHWLCPSSGRLAPSPG